LLYTKAICEQREQPEQSEQSEQPEQPEQSEQPEQREQPEQSEQSEQPEQRSQREQREQSEQRSQPSRLSSASLAACSVPQYSTLQRFSRASVIQVFSATLFSFVFRFIPPLPGAPPHPRSAHPSPQYSQART
jgi:outer membrane biosynthesis protein TonB